MANPLITDSGYNGQILSLGGVLGADGKGRTSLTAAFTLTGASQIVLLANPKRISALLCNTDDAANPGSLVYLYTWGSGAPVLCILTALGTYQIDINLPWTGEILALAPLNSPVLISTEVAIV